jgi:glycosyltransferase involved in cell wall biosynthesis
LLPYVDDERARYRSPLKLYEYMAAGRPVVATRNPEAVEQADWVYLSDSPQGFLENLEQARCDDSPDLQRHRQASAAVHDWDRRVDEMERIIQEALES